MLAPALAAARAMDAPAAAPALDEALRSLGAAARLPRQIQRLGQRCRELRAASGEPNHLLAQLNGMPRDLTAQQIAESLLRQRASDFRANHIVIVDGWVFARAEAELCELLATTGASP